MPLSVAAGNLRAVLSAAQVVWLAAVPVSGQTEEEHFGLVVGEIGSLIVTSDTF